MIWILRDESHVILRDESYISALVIYITSWSEYKYERYGSLQQVSYWKAWFTTTPRHRWLYLQSTKGQEDRWWMYYVEVFEEPEVEVSLLLLLQPIGSEPLNWTKTAYQRILIFATKRNLETLAEYQYGSKPA